MMVKFSPDAFNTSCAAETKIRTNSTCCLVAVAQCKWFPLQVCGLLSRGNWTLERDEDLTGLYSYLANRWIAFDDDTSLKIKAK